MDKLVVAECSGCESTFNIEYIQESTSQEYPEYCPFCGDAIEEITESYIDEDDSDDEDNGEWD